MKRLFIVFLITLMMAFSWCPIAEAYSSPTVYLNGSQLYFDVPAQIISGRAMVPMRAIFEALGANVTWDYESQKVIATKGSITLEMQVGSNIYYLNGTAKVCDVAIQMTSGRVMVPLRIVAECLECKVDYNFYSNSITLISGSNPEDVVVTVNTFNNDTNEFRAGIYGQKVPAKNFTIVADLANERSLILDLGSSCTWYTGDGTDQYKVSTSNGNLNYTIDFPNRNSGDSRDGGNKLVITFHGGDLPKDPAHAYRITVEGLKINARNDAHGCEVMLNFSGSVGLEGSFEIGRILF